MSENEKNYLTDEESIERIQAYIKESIYQYAVMIDGEWGCGRHIL